MILKSLIKLTNKKLILPFYHCVDNKSVNYTKHLYKPKSILDFKKDLDFFLKHYTPISLEELMNLKKGNFKPKKTSFHLTFDDGLSNFYHVIAPILIKKKIPATIFLNTDFIDNKHLFYRYKVSLLIENFINGDDEVKIKYYQFFKNYIESNKLLTEKVIQFLLNIKFDNRNLLDELAGKLNFSFEDFLDKEKPYLTLEQIKELQKQGFTFGSHSRNHPHYARLNLINQLEQTNTSIKWISKYLNSKYKTFSFPFDDINVKDAFFKKTASKLDLTFGTSGIKKSNYDFHLQRLDMEKSGRNTKLFLIKRYLKLLINFVR